MPKGLISLPLTVGENLITIMISPEWVVVSGSSAFNAVIGRPTLLELITVTSVKFLTIKFLTMLRIRIFKGDQTTAISCYPNYIKMSQDKYGHLVMIVQIDLDQRLSSKSDVDPGDDIELVAPNLTEPEKNLQVGKFLDPGIKVELISLLANNLDAFA